MSCSQTSSATTPHKCNSPTTLFGEWYIGTLVGTCIVLCCLVIVNGSPCREASRSQPLPANSSIIITTPHHYALCDMTSLNAFSEFYAAYACSSLSKFAAENNDQLGLS